MFEPFLNAGLITSILLSLIELNIIAFALLFKMTVHVFIHIRGGFGVTIMPNCSITLLAIRVHVCYLYTVQG